MHGEDSEKIQENFSHMVKKKIKMLAVFAVLAILAVIAAAAAIRNFSSEKEPEGAEVITESTLYQIINISDLSTYQCVYNDVCVVPGAEGDGGPAYYCAYEAKVSAGIDFEKVTVVGIDREQKIITISIPEVEITDVNVDISSLDYMFEDDSVNTTKVSAEAYQACIADVEQKSVREEKIYELAQQNAENIIKALINPFVAQLDSEYVLEIEIQE